MRIILMTEIMINRNKMSALYVVLVLLPFFCQNFAADLQQSSGVSAGDTDIFLEKIIIKQQKSCPYISLCTTSNESASFNIEFDTSVPCCMPCSCNDSCVESGTCCPDFRFRYDINKTDTKPGDDDRECVEVRHGMLNDETAFEAYRMIASCPRKFTDATTILRCHSDFDSEETESWKDNIPVYDELTGQVYKNKYCYLCNENITSNVKFWDIKLNCTGYFKMFFYTANSPRELAERYVAGGNMCDVTFHIASQSQNTTNVQLERCNRSGNVTPYISTCKPEYVGSPIEKSCTNYTWPVRRNKGLGFVTYKNLACLLCNNVFFMETCSIMNISKFYSVALTSDGNHLNLHHNSIEITINKYFPDSSGKTICEKGYILHKNECHRVLCPQSFFIKDGECIPMLKTLTGVSYVIYLNMVLSRTASAVNTTPLELALYSALTRRLQRYLENGKFIISLWRNGRTTRILNANRRYYVLIDFTGQEDFLAFVKFLHWFVVSRNRLEINLNTELTKTVFVDLRFSNSLILVRGEPVTFKGEALYLVKPKSWRSKVRSSMTQAEITSKSLCYRVAINTSAIDFAHYRRIKVLETGRFLSSLNFDYHDSRIILCVEDAFKGVNGDAKYLFGYRDMNGNEVNVKEDKEHTKSDGYGTNDNEDTSGENETFTKSLIATVCSTGVVAFVIFIRKLFKYLTERNRDSTTGYTTTINLERHASKAAFKTKNERSKEVRNSGTDSSATAFCTENSQEMSFSKFSLDRFQHVSEDDIPKINKNLNAETKLSFITDKKKRHSEIDDLQEFGDKTVIKGTEDGVVKNEVTREMSGKTELLGPGDDDEGDNDDDDDFDDTTQQEMKMEMKVNDKRRIAVN